MIAIIDYGVGNIFSLRSSFSYIGAEAVLTNDKEIIKKADRIVLPGVGAFGDAAQKLKNTGLWDFLKEQVAEGKPFLGICLGMQLLFEKSYEFGEYEGLGFIEGSVKPITPVLKEELKIPHIGWNKLHFPDEKEKSKLFMYINEGDFVYFVHSYFGADCESSVTSTTDYSVELTASVEKGNVYGVQFHPEKSGEIGMKILKAFCEL